MMDSAAVSSIQPHCYLTVRKIPAGKPAGIIFCKQVLLIFLFVVGADALNAQAFQLTHIHGD